MKNGKRPSIRQKEAIKSAGWDPDNWLVSKAPPGQLHIVSRSGKSKKVIPA
ncbi:MAG: hypothetical protein JWR03_2608 [Cohnella sp.]|nr:hypothetical protein [Cohnella sp.]